MANGLLMRLVVLWVIFNLQRYHLRVVANYVIAPLWAAMYVCNYGFRDNFYVICLTIAGHECLKDLKFI